MKASDLIKKALSLEEIEKAIKQQNDYCCFKHFIPNHIFVSDETKLKLMENGFKVYKGPGIGNEECLIIEW